MPDIQIEWTVLGSKHKNLTISCPPTPHLNVIIVNAVNFILFHILQ